MYNIKLIDNFITECLTECKEISFDAFSKLNESVANHPTVSERLFESYLKYKDIEGPGMVSINEFEEIKEFSEFVDDLSKKQEEEDDDPEAGIQMPELDGNSAQKAKDIEIADDKLGEPEKVSDDLEGQEAGEELRGEEEVENKIGENLSTENEEIASIKEDKTEVNGEVDENTDNKDESEIDNNKHNTNITIEEAEEKPEKEENEEVEEEETEKNDEVIENVEQEPVTVETQNEETADDPAHGIHTPKIDDEELVKDIEAKDLKIGSPVALTGDEKGVEGNVDLKGEEDVEKLEEQKKTLK